MTSSLPPKRKAGRNGATPALASGGREQRAQFASDAAHAGRSTSGKSSRSVDVFTKVSASKLMHKGEAVISGKWTKLDEETCTK